MAFKCILYNVDSRDGTIQVFSELNLIWVAKLPSRRISKVEIDGENSTENLNPTYSDSVPVEVKVAEFGGQKGLIVSLDDGGHLVISYLGTRPPLNAVPSLSAPPVGGGGIGSARDVDYDRLDEEHRSLLQIIRDSQSEKKQEPKDQLVIRAQVGVSI